MQTAKIGLVHCGDYNMECASVVGRSCDVLFFLRNYLGEIDILKVKE